VNLFEEVDTGLDGLGQLRALIRSGRKPGIARSLDFEFVEAEAGRAVFAGTPGEHAYNPIGTVHGGYAATLLEFGLRLRRALAAPCNTGLHHARSERLVPQADHA
jgi:hypothetical protein